MERITINFENLTSEDRNMLLSIAKRTNKSIQIADVKVGETFEIAGINFIKFADDGDAVTAVSKDSLFSSHYGANNDFSQSIVFDKLKSETLPKIEKAVGEKNVLEFETNLVSLDGAKPYGTMISKISLPTFDFYRENVKLFDEYKLDKWWWLSTPYCTNEHGSDTTAACVSPSGFLSLISCDFGNFGVRPFLRFSSSIFVPRNK